MARRSPYDTSAVWDDPYDAPDNKREASRFNVRMKVVLAVDCPERGGQLIGDGVVKNISQSGVQVHTKHALEPGQRIVLSVPTDMLGGEMLLPETFSGMVDVQRVEPVDGRVRVAALRFSEDFTQNMDFVVFIDNLHAVAGLMSRSNTM
ncbi:MAG TPA: PilZ domain-containing protein [Candidatus Hydrogenedentes bacterium]|nr:PilZ domain-containing protein [Candidatus Hydrogenedentota bacterium]HIJ73190.1 PilZ domain-containing protein [Candidatus Hydrogenedentota bacterium]